MSQYSHYQPQYHSASGMNIPGLSGTNNNNFNYMQYHGGMHNNNNNNNNNSDRFNSGFSNYYFPQNGGGHGRGSNGTQSKTVCRMDCRYCSAVVCLRGMKAMLLADTSVELYSTDHPPGSVQLIEKDYTTSNCKCKIRDVACKVCGNIIGYHITQPCQQCLKAPNNGHFWMFHAEGVVGQERLSLDLGKLIQILITDPTSTFSVRHNNNSNNNNNSRSNNNNTRLTTTTSSRTGSSSSYASYTSTPETSTTPSTPVPSSLRRNSAASETTVISDSDTISDENPPSTHTRSASAVLASLSISQFLQPMKWEQLPHPDLDIDLDPNSIGGEPLFSEQWKKMVIKTAEAVAVNMSLALDQEEETERYLERMVEEKNMEVDNDDSDSDTEYLPDSEESEDFTDSNLQDEATISRIREGESMERLIDQVDEFGLSSSSEESDEHKDNEEEGNSPEMSRRVTRSLIHRELESQPGDPPAPEQEGEHLNSRERRRQNRLSNSSDHTVHNPADGYPAYVLNSAMIAKAAASAAAADAASATNSLLYGRRVRREYETMCR